MIKRDAWLLAALIVALLPFKLWLTRAAGIELHYDEAQYWEWSRELDWSYYSKGPMVAWLIAASEALFGHSDWQTRLPAWLAHGLLLAIMYGFAYDVWRSRAAAWWAVAIAFFTPLYFTLGMVMTTDVWLFLCWTAGLWAAYRAIVMERYGYWYAAGAAVGLGALNKLSIGLLPAAVGIAILLSPRWRHHLKRPELWGGLALMAVIMSPVILWNATHDWVMLRHEAGHVDSAPRSPLGALEFLAGQAFALSPLVVLVALRSLWRRPSDPGQRLLWYLSLGWIAFFTFKAARGEVLLNWAAPSYIGLWILLAGHVAEAGKAWRRVVLAGFATAAIFMAVAIYPYAFGLDVKQDAFKKTRQWSRPVSELARMAGPVDFVITPNYRLTAELAFYWPGGARAYVAKSAERRYNQHDLWPGIEREAGRDGLWVSEGPSVPPQLEAACTRLIPLLPLRVAAPSGTALRTLHASRCEDYRPIEWPEPSSY